MELDGEKGCWCVVPENVTVVTDAAGVLVTVGALPC